MPSSIISKSSSWPGFPGIRKLFIFGDSLSSVTLQTKFTDRFHPDATNPLAVEFPGTTYNEPDQPNWVGHLITKYCPGSRFNPDGEQDDDWKASPFLVYNYARGGDQVMGVQRQIQTLFHPTVGQKPQWAPWTENDSLFVTWVGTNDCAWVKDYDERTNLLFSLQEELYNKGARNFLFIDVPPIDRSPCYGNSSDPTKASDIFRSWNGSLRANARDFAEKHTDCTVLLFSAHHIFNMFLDDMEVYGFPPSDAKRKGGSVWVDHIHPTSKVHDIIAHNLADFLSDIPVQAL